MPRDPFRAKLCFHNILKYPRDLQILLKYAPKYYNKIHYEVSEFQRYAIFKKNKAIKIMRVVNVKSSNPSAKAILIEALKNKKKTLKSLEGLHQTLLSKLPCCNSFTLDVYNLQSWKSFARVLSFQTLRLNFKQQTAPKVGSMQYLRIATYAKYRFWRHLIRLKKIRHLQIDAFKKIDAILSNFLTELSSKKVSLATLKTFSLGLYGFTDHSMLPISNFDVSQQITTIKIKEPSIKILDQLLGNLKTFSALKEFQLLKNTNRHHETSQHMDMTFFQGLAFLPALEKLELAINFYSGDCFFNFLESFTIPTSITAVKLKLIGVHWKYVVTSLKTDDELQQVENPFEGSKNKLCQRFYQQWKNLQHLKLLSIQLLQDEEISPYFGVYFSTPLLKNLKNLTSFEYVNLCNTDKETFDFGSLWQPLSQLALRSLYIETPPICLDGFTAENSSLSQLSLSTTVIGDCDLKKLFVLFNKDSEKSHLNINNLLVNNDEMFVKLCQDLCEAPRNLQISINVNLKKISSGDTFVQVITDVISKLSNRNFSQLKFSNLKGITRDLLEQLRTLLQDYELTNKIILTGPKGRLLLSRRVWSVDDLFSQDNDDSMSQSNQDAQGFEFMDQDDDDDDSEDYEEEEEIEEDDSLIEDFEMSHLSPNSTHDF